MEFIFYWKSDLTRRILYAHFFDCFESLLGSWQSECESLKIRENEFLFSDVYLANETRVDNVFLTYTHKHRHVVGCLPAYHLLCVSEVHPHNDFHIVDGVNVCVVSIRLKINYLVEIHPQ